MDTRRTILLVDDDQFARVVLRDSLSREPFRIVEARDGAEAMTAIASSEPDLVILDLLMPNLSGMDVLAQLRNVRPELRVLVLSSLDTPSLIEEARRFGAIDFIGKPFHPLEIVEAVRRLLPV